MTALPPCHLCGGALAEIEGFAALPRITSDCRPWPSGGRLAVCACCHAVQKPVDPQWLEEVGRVYAGYAIYHQAAGAAEQQVFGPDGGQPRSARLLSKVLECVDAPAAGRLLDVGCGNGGLLRSCSRLMPGWKLSGSELSDQHRAEIEAIPGVEAFHSGALSGIPGGYDLVTSVHCLEHIPNPAAALGEMTGKLAPGGSLVIEVPDFTQNPFDLLVADHCTHFEAATLAATMAKGGCAVRHLAADWIPKELTVIAGPGAPTPSDAVPAAGEAAHRAVAWLTALRDRAFGLARGEPIGLFGTSIAGTWLAAQMEAELAFFVDEDPSRIGRDYMGRPVLSPDQVPDGALVYLPLAPKVAASVAARLGGSRRYVAP
jgi:SAM-dependent methyltransferase